MFFLLLRDPPLEYDINDELNGRKVGGHRGKRLYRDEKGFRRQREKGGQREREYKKNDAPIDRA